ncbi:HlyD family efflux transporter periplasmic adaptor subunit [Microcoleus sp. FACHB-SPT15]|uniref:HlyD family secretion protein n=1 Tax=Microcoleus sp. FACHB-SPT15 TaxID=2692830 RepID=UPI0017852387|nr:HlyD family efflux transporter periplasmic adaptor subunit [Microcoleus sp. FACHB-SPT15]MBD1806501.1 HlyD family efflux transporter periplasmic adaptor subunit [Microcoleus sp. FACHB-SPT15]
MTNNSPINPDGLRSVHPDEFLPPIDRWATLGGVAMLAIFGAAITLAAVLEYPATVKAPASVRPTGELRIVQAAATGKVKRLEVKAYQAVQQGEAIAYLDDSRLQTQKRQLSTSIQQNQRQLERIKTQIQAVQAQITAEEQAIDRAIAAATGELKLNRREHQERQVATQAEVQEARSAAQLAQEELARYRELANTGAVAELQISEKAVAVDVALARLQRARSALDPSTASVEIATERVAQERARGASTLATLNREREALSQQLFPIQNQIIRDRQELQQVETELANTVIRTPVTGTIQQLNLQNIDQLVSSGDAIAQIAPSNVPLVVKAFVAPQDIGRVEVGQAVKIEVSGCPYPDYGTLAGILTTISPDVTARPSHTATSSEREMPSPTVNSRYEVTIQPETFFLRVGDRQCNLQAGMNGNADIITRKETVLTFFLRKARLLLDS